jgi:dihydrofolate reductase
MISIIVCIAQNSAIGFENKLLYWLPNDLKRFKQLTTGHTIIMGRRTFESFPKGALPNRRNVVLSRQADAHFEGADHYCTLEEALASCRPDEEIYIIGGSTVYQQAMPLADRLLITHVEDTPEQADAFFPIIDLALWKEVNREEHGTDEKHHYPYSFVDYERI